MAVKKGQKLNVMKHRKHQLTFDLWYSLDRNYEKTAKEMIGKLGFSASVATVRRWAEQYGWMERARKMDEALELRLATDAVRRQAAMIQRHSTLGRAMQIRGGAFLQPRPMFDNDGKPLLDENGKQRMAVREINDPDAARQMIKAGIEIERQAEGLPDYVAQVLAMSDEEALEQYNRERAALLAATEALGDDGASGAEG